MGFFEDIRGNDTQKSLFEALIREGRLSHSYILEAPRGGGKKMMAYRLAATLAYHEDASPAGEAKCRRILAGTSPDVKLLSRDKDDKKTIGVSAVRDFVSSVYLTPSELGFKMYIFDEADRITPQAQNALLKVIEEPPHDVYLILLCENSLSLLATVRSRSQKIVLDRFSEAALANIAREELSAVTADAEKLQFASRMAHGAIGRLREVLENGDAEFSAFQMAKKIVEGQAAKASRHGVTYHAFLKSICDFADSREALQAVTEYLLTAYGDLARAICEEAAKPSFFTEDEVNSHAMALSIAAIDESFSAVGEVLTDMKINASLSMAAATLGMRLWNAV